MMLKNEIFQVILCCTVCAILGMSYLNTLYVYDPRDTQEPPSLENPDTPFVAPVPITYVS
jgi:hypothetical protein